LSSKIKYDLILLLAAVIWGFAFVAQRMGMDYVGPFTYTAVRFTLGTLVLLPFLVTKTSKQLSSVSQLSSHSASPAQNGKKKLLLLQLLLGLVLFGGISFQQYGLQYTTAGNAGFITGFYVVLVPLAGLFNRHKPHLSIWIGMLLAIIGLYLLSVKENFTINPGDYYVGACALFWTAHVLLVSYLAPRTNPIRIAVIQFTVCSILSWIVAAGAEEIIFSSIMDAWGPILYGGLLSVGIGYTLQVVAQQKAHPAYASIILSMESVFAVIGGWLILGEHLSSRALAGCFLMFSGMIIVQVMGSEKGTH
jgi:drug/metabolite transporter (DMT)-like permease